jgi:hypothetical protein
MTDLETFADITFKQGGEWWKIEENEKYSLYLCKMKHMIEKYVYYDQPIYELFDSSGKRVFATADRIIAYQEYKKLSNI